MLTEKQLKILGGWAQYFRKESPPELDQAFLELVESIEELLPLLPEEIEVAAEVGPPLAPWLRSDPQPRFSESAISMAKRAMSDLPPPVIEIPDDIPINRPSCTGKDHVFDISTQCCKFCGSSYFEVMSRKSELM